jgi:hypothetical protein
MNNSVGIVHGFFQRICIEDVAIYPFYLAYNSGVDIKWNSGLSAKSFNGITFVHQVAYHVCTDKAGATGHENG